MHFNRPEKHRPSCSFCTTAGSVNSLRRPSHSAAAVASLTSLCATFRQWRKILPDAHPISWWRASRPRNCLALNLEEDLLKYGLVQPASNSEPFGADTGRLTLCDFKGICPFQGVMASSAWSVPGGYGHDAVN
jgi:hypothetical protein